MPQRQRHVAIARLNTKVEGIFGTPDVVNSMPSLYGQILGERFAHLPQPLAVLHSQQAVKVFRGEVRVDGGVNFFARLLADSFGFPRPGRRQTFELRITTQPDGSEIWQRCVGDGQWCTRQSCYRGKLLEQFGALKATMSVPSDGSGLSFQVERLTLFGVPFPASLSPKISSVETVVGVPGRLAIDVDIVAPMIGRLVHYRGWMASV